MLNWSSVQMVDTGVTSSQGILSFHWVVVENGTAARFLGRNKAFRPVSSVVRRTPA